MKKSTLTLVLISGAVFDLLRWKEKDNTIYGEIDADGDNKDPHMPEFIQIDARQVAARSVEKEEYDSIDWQECGTTTTNNIENVADVPTVDNVEEVAADVYPEHVEENLGTGDADGKDTMVGELAPVEDGNGTGTTDPDLTGGKW